MVLAVVYYAWTPVRMWCCRRRVAGSVDAALEERLKRLEGNAQPVSFLFLPRCSISPCQFSLYLPTCLLPTCLLVYLLFTCLLAYFLLPISFLQGVFSAHLREGDGAEYRGLLSGRGGGGGGDVPHRVRLQDPGKLF